MPRRPAVFAAENGEAPGWWLMRAFAPLIFVNRGDADRRRVRAPPKYYGRGVLGVAPEGTRSRTGALQKRQERSRNSWQAAPEPHIAGRAWGQERFIRSLLHLRRPDVQCEWVSS